VYTYCGNQQALQIAERMAGWVDARSQRLSAEHWQRILDVEFGGLNEALYNLYAITHNARISKSRGDSTTRRFTAPCRRRDTLKGLHANTTIPKIIGAAGLTKLPGIRGSQNRRVLLAASRGASLLCNRRTSNHELWRTAADELAVN